MLDWTEENDRVEGTNKMLDLRYHGGVSANRESSSPYAVKNQVESTIRAATSPVGERSMK